MTIPAKLTMALIDKLRAGKDKKAMGPMRFDGATGLPIDPGARPTGGGDLRDRKIAQAMRDAGV